MRSILALIGPKAAFARGEAQIQRSGPRKPGTGWSGWYLGLGRTRPYTHHSRPLQGLTGPLRWCRTSLRDSWVVPRYSPPPYPPTHTPPVYTLPYSHPCTACSSVLLVTGACLYDRFQDTVGEPRGAGTQPYSGSQAGYLQYIRFTRPFDWVSDPFSTRFTELWTRFTEFMTRIDRY